MPDLWLLPENMTVRQRRAYLLSPREHVPGQERPVCELPGGTGRCRNGSAGPGLVAKKNTKKSFPAEWMTSPHA